MKTLAGLILVGGLFGLAEAGCSSIFKTSDDVKKEEADKDAAKKEAAVAYTKRLQEAAKEYADAVTFEPENTARICRALKHLGVVTMDAEVAQKAADYCETNHVGGIF